MGKQQFRMCFILLLRAEFVSSLTSVAAVRLVMQLLSAAELFLPGFPCIVITERLGLRWTA